MEEWTRQDMVEACNQANQRISRRPFPDLDVTETLYYCTVAKRSYWRHHRKTDGNFRIASSPVVFPSHAAVLVGIELLQHDYL